MNPYSSNMTPTTTAPRTKRCRDDADVPSLTEESSCGERNKRARPNSVENGTLSLQHRLPPCIAQPQTMATLAVVEHEAMNSTAPEAVSSNQNERLDDFTGIPDAAYQPMWSFLLDSTSCTAPSLDFKSIRSFMLANKASKGAFDDCKGWWFCAQALKRETEAKRLLMNRFVERAYYMRGAFFFIPSFREEVDQARETNSRIQSIQRTFLPQANRLTVLSYGSEEVSIRWRSSEERFIGKVEYFARWRYEIKRMRERLINEST
jgi:hypothetical protein